MSEKKQNISIGFLLVIVLLGVIIFYLAREAELIGCKYNPLHSWRDSYSVDGQCYCDTTFDHNIGPVVPEGYEGKNVEQVCKAIKRKFGVGPEEGRIFFNDVQCGNGPGNGEKDEVRTPGIVGKGGCDQTKGPKWPSYEKLFKR